MAKFTKEEKIILITIVSAAIIGILINALVSYNKKIEKKPRVSSEPIILNINTASAEQLDKLPGIGSAYAERIIKYREENNGFKSIDEVTNVKGIGKVTFSKMKPYITIKTEDK